MKYLRLKNKLFSIKSVLLVILFFLGAIFEIFIKVNYLDEVLCLVCIFYLFIMILKNKVKKNDMYMIILLLVIVITGIISNLKSGLINNCFLVVVDIIAEIKVIVIFFTAKYFVNYEIKKDFINLLYIPSKIFIFLAFIFGIITLFINTGMYTDIRYGIPSYTFIFPMAFQLFVFLGLSLYVVLEKDYKKNRKYIFFALIVCLLITKGPQIIFAALFLILNLYYKRNKKIKLKIVIPIVIIVLLLGSFQISTYLTNENAPRYLFFKYGGITANTYFPLGSGFGTFGSDIAARNYSLLYIEYGFNKLFGMNQNDGSFLSDTFWITPIAQFGWIFGILYILIYIYIFFVLQNKNYNNNRVKTFAVTFHIQYMIHAVGSAILSSSAGVFGYFLLGIIASDDKN